MFEKIVALLAGRGSIDAAVRFDGDGVTVIQPGEHGAAKETLVGTPDEAFAALHDISADDPYNLSFE